MTMLDDPKALRVLDAMPDAVLIVSGEGMIEWANTRAEQVFGYARAELARPRNEARGVQEGRHALSRGDRAQPDS